MLYRITLYLLLYVTIVGCNNKDSTLSQSEQIFPENNITTVVDINITTGDDTTTVSSSDLNGSTQEDTTTALIKDVESPYMQLYGEEKIYLDISQSYDELGAIAIDDRDGNLTAFIHITSDVQEGVEGNYTVRYTVVDTTGNFSGIVRYVYIQDNLKALDTTPYKINWFNRAKNRWNAANPSNLYNYDYYSYKFPLDADRVPGTPPDEPILPKQWMQTAGLGFSKFLKYPFDETSRYRYNDAQVKEWKSKRFRNGRLHVPLYEMVDLAVDPTGATLKTADLEKIKNICQVFVDNDIPITISIVSGDANLSDNMLLDRNETFRRTVEWWRQLASYMKDMSYLVAFENYVEYHGFDNVPIEKREFKIYVENNETHYLGYQNYRKWKITNWVRSPGYNNLMAEIARVVRITNPKRIMLYKPNGIGRSGLVNITPWRWGSEADYLQINNTREPYWLMSCGGSANIQFDYIKALRSNTQAEQDTFLQSARKGSWGPAVDFYNGTKIPTWISLFGLKADMEKVNTQLGGIDITTDELVQYIDWYQMHIQNDARDENGTIVKFSSGFQQTPWIWDFKNQIWFNGTLNNRWNNFEKVRETLSKWAQEYPRK